MARLKNKIDTKNKILDAAARVIDRKGYHAASIAEICQLAGTNIASVNYHFGDKKNLYVETWKNAFNRALEKHPPDGGMPETAPADQRLRGWITAMLRRVTDPACLDFAIAHVEMTNPTGILTEVINDNISRVFTPLAELVREMLGPEADEEDVRLSMMSIRSQCFNPLILNKRKTDSPDRPSALTSDLEGIAEHIIRFSLGGLDWVRQALDRDRDR